MDFHSSVSLLDQWKISSGFLVSTVLMAEFTYVVKLKPHQAKTIAPFQGQLDIELTERCNNVCIHCLINQPKNDENVRAREMDTAFIKEILRQAADLNYLTVRFTGGEPLLRDDFTELYSFTRRLGMYVILFTNARLVTPKIAQLFARIPPGRAVEVTVYGMSAQSYDTVAATRGAFSEFWRGVELLKQHNIPFIVKQSILPPNRSEIAEFEAFAATLPLMDRKPAYTMNFELRARRDNPAKNRLINSFRLSPEETVEILARNSNYRKSMREFARKFMRPPGDKLFNCGAGLSTCVDAYGKAQMCLGLRHPDMVYDLHCYGEVTNSGSQLRHVLTEIFPHLRETCATEFQTTYIAAQSVSSRVCASSARRNRGKSTVH